MDDVIDELISQCAIKEIEFVHQFEHFLEEQGFMIVPIEDPTNLRFGVDE